jgi:hypothetical protein
MSKPTGPTTVTIPLYDENGNPLLDENGNPLLVPLSIITYTRIQMRAQAKSRVLGREVTFDEMVDELLEIGLLKAKARGEF